LVEEEMPEPEEPTKPELNSEAPKKPAQSSYV